MSLIQKWPGCTVHAEVTTYTEPEMASRLHSIIFSQVSSICFTLNNIIVGGWFRALALYNNSRRSDDDADEHHTTPKYFGHRLHKEDVLSMTHVEPNMLASASYDGDIYVWDLNTDRVTNRLNAWDEQGRMPQSMAKETCLK